MKNNDEWTISYKQLGIIIFSFSLGLIGTLLISNSQSASTTSFSTTELIGFVMSVILSGASIVLAISAIALGKSSERAVIDRSDESIRLQNEVFIRTNEALQRIEASTGVTEKRIEDIITGRVGDISQKIAGLASDGDSRSGHSKKELEEEIKATLMNAIRGGVSKASEDPMEKYLLRKQEIDDKYEKLHDSLMEKIKNIDGIVVGKIGHGSPSKKGDDQIDSIFTHKGKRIGVSTFRENADSDTFEMYFRGVAKQIESGSFSAVFAFSIGGKNFEEAISEILNPYKNELKECIKYKKIDPVEIESIDFEKIISNNSIQPNANASAD
jgi:hypothetical protein